MLDRILSYIKGTQSNFNKGKGKRGEYKGIDEEKVWEDRYEKCGKWGRNLSKNKN